MEKITDYLHFYIGQECSADGERFILKGVICEDGNNGAFTGESIDGMPQLWWIENCDFKLYLREMDETVKQFNRILEGFERTKKLLDNGFDIFGLIDKGLAFKK